ncbi:ribosomal protein [Hirsutella rhossiliensis]|uniref:Ribosomal protein s17 domain-containing protein n=1 Tax=Hirsutella rhossiliensis TaxID=111463 RepID=A0A9P8MMN5_9HYPO|nr:ribosomal protein s17 domain-containing protein [Hirsutella rhossiliensis]KAH0957955.1 ribosomal protein s17 domain-containing protein [Hirsutella rhossiliensis]
MSSPVAKAARRVTRELHGVVVSAGLMQKTVKVRVGGQKWNKVVNKWFADPKHYLVHDPNSSLRTGDVISIVPGWPTSQHKRHVVKHIIAPYGVPIEERPPVPTLEERITERETKKAAKDQRKAVRRTEDDEKAGKGVRKEAESTRERLQTTENSSSEVD